MKSTAYSITIALLILNACSRGPEKDMSSLLFETVVADLGPSGTNLANLSFDGFSRDNIPVVSCDADNSSGKGIRINLPTDIFAGGYYLKIGTVPSTSPYLFPENGDLDLFMSASHLPADPPSCTLTRTVNTNLRYTASVSSNCILMGGHTLTRFEVDCKPD